MTYILDRFENDLAVLVNEDGCTVNLPRADFTERREGDVFTVTDGAFVFDEAATAERRSRIKSRFSKLVKRGRR